MRTAAAVVMLPVALAFVILAPCCSDDVHDARIVETTAAVGSMTVVRFPAPWTVRTSGHDRILTLPSTYVLRGSGPALLFRREGVGVGLSDDVFAVAPGERSEARAATQEQWARATPVRAIARRVAPPPGGADGAFIEFGGKRFRARGARWGVGLPSPDARWLAVASYTGRPRRWTLRPCVFGPCTDEPTEGAMFVEVFDVATGQRVQFARGDYAGVTAGVIYGDAFWGERGGHFVMPLDISGQSCLLATLPAR